MTNSTLKILPALLGAAAILLLISSPAQAGYIVTLEQVGSNVVATGTGAIDLTGLSFNTNGLAGPGITPNGGYIECGAMSVGSYSVGLSGPTSFGAGTGGLASSSSGDAVGIYKSFNDVFVPVGYVSDTALSDSATYDNATFSSLGVTPGTYEWTWGTGADQNFTLVIPATVPDSGSTFGLLFLALIALFVAARFRSSQLA
jgi:hypothetical protein